MANEQLTILTSAQRGAGTVNVDFTLAYARGLTLVVDVTAVEGDTHTLDVKLQYHDTTSDGYVDITGAAIAQRTAIGTSVLTVYPGITAAANTKVDLPCGGRLRCVATVGGTGTPKVTYSIGALIHA